MRIVLALLALFCLGFTVQAQTYTDDKGTTYQLQTVRVCDGNSCHLEQRWVSVAQAPAATFDVSAPAAKMPKTPAQSAEPPMACASCEASATVGVRFPLAHAAVDRGRGLFHHLRHPFGGRFALGVGNCGCNGACGGAGCTCR